MDVKTKLLIGSAALIGCFLAGRLSAPEKVVEKRVEVEKTQKSVDTDKEQHLETTKTTVTKPDGTTETTEKVVVDTKKKTDLDVTKEKDVSTEKTVTFQTSKVTISLMVGSELSLPLVPVYGLSVTKPIMGPITVGAWGLSNRVFGVSAGLTF